MIERSVREPSSSPRLATAADAESVLALEQKIHVRTYSSETHVSTILRAMQVGSMYVIEVGSVIVAMICWEPKDGMTYLADVVVDPEVQGRGLGRRLMEVFDRHTPAGLASCLLVHPDNERARKLYESVGFVPIGVIEDAYGDGEPRLKMVRPPLQIC